jgi:hypothetical protein
LRDPNLKACYQFAYGQQTDETINGTSGILRITQEGDPITYNGEHPRVLGQVELPPSVILSSPDSEDLRDFSGMLAYSPPELAVYPSMGLTAIEFINSSNYGKEYENDMLVGDFHNGDLYQFNESMEELILNGQLSDKIADNLDDLQGNYIGMALGESLTSKLIPMGTFMFFVFIRGAITAKLTNLRHLNILLYRISATR